MPTPTLTIVAQSTNNNFVWSENKIIHRVNLSGATGLKLIIDIKNAGGDLIATLTYPAVDGNMDIDLQPVLRELVLPVRPVVKYGVIVVSTPTLTGGTAAVKIYTRLSSWAAPGILTEKVLIYGGWDSFDFSEAGNQNSYTTFYPIDFYCNTGEQARILSHMPTGRMMDAGAFGFITYIQEKPAIAGQKIVYLVKYISSGIGSTSVIVKTFPESVDKTTWYIPVGIGQVNMDPTGKGVEYCDITVQGDGDVILARYRIRYDNRPWYNWLDIHYRNSLGGWDFFRFKGNIACSTDMDRLEYELKTNATAAGANNFYSTQMKVKWAASTGYITRQEMVALNDLLRSKDVCILIDNKFYPLKCTTKTLKWDDSSDGLWSEVFEFETAGKFNTIPRQLMQLFSKPPELRS